MASGGYRPPGNTTDFLEEWKAKREKMRARFAAATGANNANSAGANNAESGSSRNGAAPPAELNNNGGGGERAAAPPLTTGAGGVRSAAPAPAPKRLDEDGSGAAKSNESGARNSPAEACDLEAEMPPAAATAAASSPPTCTKNKDKMKSSGPSARKGKGQIEKRKLREKRRSTGVVNIPSTESPDDDEHSEQKLHQREDVLTQQNTIQNESITSDASSPYNETPRTTSRWKSTNAPEEDIAVYSSSSRYSGRAERPGYNRYGNTSSSTLSSTLEKKLEEFEKELTKERQENQKLVKLLQDRDDLIGKLKEEIDLLNRDLDEIEDENDQLKQENKTLLKVVGQLTR
ncbi:PRKC apoptosis WT1 regulator protein [Heterodontus francisci]|uniref:PRKC apoptosis WT1 regulator protein n=1 Tax=Heterodontus francisci TaxID=7792 RepID=UPI00355B8204